MYLVFPSEMSRKLDLLRITIVQLMKFIIFLSSMKSEMQSSYMYMNMKLVNY